MPFSARIKRLVRSYPFRVGCAALIWLIFISSLHHYLNREHEGRKTLMMGYMPVITNMAAPILDSASLQGHGDIRFRAMKFASFSEMAEAFRNDRIQAAFIIAPLSIVLKQQGEDIKIVYIGNRHESTLVTRKELNIKKFDELEGYKIAVPLRYSGHNLVLQRLIRASGLEDVQIVEMNPPDMTSALTAGSLDAYFVGEPFAAKTIKGGESNSLFYVEQVQQNFICNLLIVKQQLIEKDEEAVRRLVEGAARAGLWAKKNRLEAVRICAQYWGQPADLVEYALNTPEGRIIFDKFVPSEVEMKAIADEMVDFGLIQNARIEGLVESRFALQADISDIKQSISTIIR